VSNWVMVLYVITALSNHGTRVLIDGPENENEKYYAYADKATCEATLVKVEAPHGREGMECTPFFANMGPTDLIHPPDHLHRGRVRVTPH
jgi:hypothetical protein